LGHYITNPEGHPSGGLSFTIERQSMNIALQHLHNQIKKGAEFPDAAYQAAQKFKVNQAALEKAYDQTCADPKEANRRAAMALRIAESLGFDSVEKMIDHNDRIERSKRDHVNALEYQKYAAASARRAAAKAPQNTLVCP
jgi:hypothetical protein